MAAAYSAEQSFAKSYLTSGQSFNSTPNQVKLSAEVGKTLEFRSLRRILEILGTLWGTFSVGSDLFYGLPT